MINLRIFQARGSNFSVLAIVTIVLGQEYYTRQVVASFFQMLWGLRLGGGLDSRFNGLREKFLPFLGFWVLSMTWVWVCSLPLTFLNSPRVSDPSYGGHDVMFGTGSDIFGVIFFVTGLLIESVADWSKATSLIATISVAANLFFGIYYNRFMGMESSSKLLWRNFTLLLFVTGLPMTEIPTQKKQYTLGHENVYFVYREQTSILIPMPPVLYKKFPDWVKRTILLDFPLYKHHPKQRPGVLSPQGTLPHDNSDVQGDNTRSEEV
ncbi:3213_t:CDS:2 [Ambispora gerdemannii]|uniref:3213_t:CDS:1 n=1 Tax=Ambispora gerdemannii TaxID=144530 RepID=A0A9N9C948_9GLOM|nr:3213_t:CDS:2 [Ambispora gerdemannii]